MDEATKATEATEETIEAVEEVTAATADLADFGQVIGASSCFHLVFLIYRQVQQRDATTRRLYRGDHKDCRGGHSCNYILGNDSGKGCIKLSIGVHDKLGKIGGRHVWQEGATKLDTHGLS